MQAQVSKSGKMMPFPGRELQSSKGVVRELKVSVKLMQEATIPEEDG